MAFATIFAASCSKDEEKTEGNASIEGRWDASRFADNPDDIAFVAIFAGENLDLYVIPWGQHMKGTYTLTNGTLIYNITEAYQAYTDVTYDDDGGYSGQWLVVSGQCCRITGELSEGFDWYAMGSEAFEQAKEDFGQFEFKISGNTATSTLVGIPDLVFRKVR